MMKKLGILLFSLVLINFIQGQNNKQTNFSYDGAISNLSVQNFVLDSINIDGTLTNNGTETIETVSISWQYDEDVYTTEYTGLNLGNGASFYFQSQDLFDYPVGSYEIGIFISSINGNQDEDPTNDNHTTIVFRSYEIVDRKPLMEEFTSSTCGPCADLNESLVPWIEENYNELTLIKYPVNWPGTGDPYYTFEIGARTNYYGVNAVPTVFVNGTDVGWQFENVMQGYEELKTNTSPFEIASTSELNGFDISINTQILSYSDIENMSVHAVVFENITTENIGSNGETEFHHVALKLLPSSSGSQHDFISLEPVSFDHTYNLQFTFVEELDDLGVVVFIQDDSNKEVYQSAYSVENGSFSDNSELSDLLVDGVSIENFDPETFSYTIALPEETTEIPVVSAISEDLNAKVIIEQSETFPGSALVHVFSEDLAQHTIYTVDFTIATGVQSTELIQDYTIAPNPAQDFISISNWENISSLEIRSLSGKLIRQINKVEERIEISDLQTGVYFISIVDQKGNKKTVKLIHTSF